VFAEHFHYATAGRKPFVVRLGRGVPLAFGHVKQRLQPVGEGFVGTKYAEIALLIIQPGNVA